MKYLFLLLLTACTALGQTATLTRPDRSKLFYPENYGGADDRAKIQAAMDAAEATGGTVMLAPKTYSITTVNSPASGDKAAGAYGLEIPSNVALVGSGPNTVLSIVSGGAYGVGVGISPKGMRTATANFGAASKVLLQDFSISAATQAESNGNLLNIVHASDWIVRRVRIGGCYFHGLELDQSRRILFEDCTWTGAYTGISGSWIQFDYGLAGPVNRPAGITTRAVEDVTFLRCICEQRTAGESSSARDLELTHNNTEMELHRITFRECQFTGRNEQMVSIVDIASANPATITGASIDAATDTLTAAGHGLWNGARVNLSTITGGAGLTVSQDYYWIYVSSTTGKLASSSANALAGTAVDVTTNATGVTLVPYVGGSVNELLFENCQFVTTHPKTFAFYMTQATGRTFRGIRFRGCEFRGPSGTFIVMGGSTSPTYNATHSLRWEGEITGCRFLFDKSQMPVNQDVNQVIANAWSSFTFADNYIEATGNFPVSVGSTYSRLGLFNNSLLTRVMRNSANWSGTGSFSVGATGFIVDIALADVAGTTRGLYVQDNVLYSTAGTGWSYGILVTTGATFPSSRAVQYSGNHGNFATTAANNIVMTGGTVGGSITSGGLGSALRDTTASTTLTAADFILNCNTASGSITVTAAPVLGRRCYILIKTNASNSLICGSTTVTALGAGILVYTDGTSTFTKSF